MAEFDSVIRPGGTGQVRTTVKTKGIQGERRKTITLDTNDPDRPVVVLHVRFESIPPVSILPTRSVRLDVTEGKRGMRASPRILVLRRDDGEPLELSVASNPFPGLDVAIAPFVPESDTGGVEGRVGDAVVTLSWVGDRGPELERSQLELATDHPSAPTLAVPVQVRFRALYQARPAALRLDVRAEDSDRIGRTTIHHGRRRPFRIESVRVTGLGSGVTARAVSDQPLASQSVELRIARNALPPGLHEGAIEVIPRGESGRVVRVPIRVNVARPPRSESPSGGVPPGTESPESGPKTP